MLKASGNVIIKFYLVVLSDGRIMSYTSPHDLSTSPSLRETSNKEGK